MPLVNQRLPKLRYYSHTEWCKLIRNKIEFIEKLNIELSRKKRVLVTFQIS